MAQTVDQATDQEDHIPGPPWLLAAPHRYSPGSDDWARWLTAPLRWTALGLLWATWTWRRGAITGLVWATLALILWWWS